MRSKNTTLILQLITLLIGLNSCAHQIIPPKVNIRYEFKHVYKYNKNFRSSSWRKKKTKREYIKYDRNGNDIEIGEYGEIWAFRRVTKNSDNTVSVVSGHGTYMKKLNTVTFKTYKKGEQIQSEEFWRYKNNKKDKLVYRIEYLYKNDKLTRELEYDEEGNISREKHYNEDGIIQIDSKKRSFYQPILRVKGDIQYEVVHDSLGREIEKNHYSNGGFLRRIVTDYEKDMVIISRYHDAPDKLWSYTKKKYENGRLISSHWNVIDSSTETKDIYEYDKNGLIIKVLHYNLNSGDEELENYTKYKYKYYKRR